MQDFIGRQIDHYHILEQVGLGGMAVVFKAYDLQFERDVALKLIRTDEIPPSQLIRLLQRFEREAKAQSRFSHPNIVTAYDYGEEDNIPYLVLAYLPGGTLKDRIRGAIPVEEALRILTPIADAVAYAHRMGVLHRDIKPSNILFSGDDRPMLTDFGIAKLLETTEATLTGTGLGVGTPEYMAPEQWQGQACEATDQYALGVVLYELVTGQKPYTAETPLAVALKQLNDPLPRPRDFNPAISEELEKVLFKALARNPGDRFDYVATLHRVILEFIQDQVDDGNETIFPAEQPAPPPPMEALPLEPVTYDALTDEQPDENVVTVPAPSDTEISTQSSTAVLDETTMDTAILDAADTTILETQPDPVELTRDQHRVTSIKNMQSAPVWLRWLIGVVIGAGLLVGGSYLLLREGPVEPTEPGFIAAEIRENQSDPTVEPTRTPAMSLASPNDPKSTSIPSATNKSEVSVNLTIPTDTFVVTKNYPIIQSSNVNLLEEIARFGTGFSGNLAYSPDGTTLAISGRNGIYIINTPDLIERGFIETGSLILSVAYSPDGSLLAAGSWDGSVYLFEADSEVLLNTLMGHVGEVHSVAFSPDGDLLISGGADTTIRLWNVVNGALMRTFEGHTDAVQSVDFSSDGITLASGGNDKTVRLWDLESGITLHKITAHTREVTNVAFSPDGTRLVSGSFDGTMALWHVDSGGRLQKYEMPYSRHVTSLAFSPDGSRLISGSYDGKLYLWYVSNGALLSTIGDAGSYDKAIFSPDGTLLAAQGDGIYLLDAGIGAPIQEQEQPNGDLTFVSFSPDGSFLATEDRDGTARLWNLKQGGRLFTLEGHNAFVAPISFSPDGTKFAGSHEDHTVHVWDLEKDVALNVLEGHNGPVTSIVFSPDGSWLASGSADRSVRLWNVDSGALMHTLEGHIGSISFLAFSPDGERLVSCVYDDTFYVWDVNSGILLNTATEASFGRGISSMIISPDGMLIAFGSTGRLNAWDIANGEMQRRLYWSTDSVTSMALTQDGKIVASAGSDKTIRLWDTESWALVNTLEGHNRQIEGIAFSSDDEILASYAFGTILLWDVPSGQILRTISDIYVESLAFSLNGRMMVLVSRNGIISLWAVASE